MAFGPGRYDPIATMARGLTGANTLVLIVVGGVDGEGFEVQSTDPHIQRKLPGLLRVLADQIEAAD